MDRHCGPGGAPHHIDAQTYRLFYCLLCRVQCRVCSRCDRGNIYCKNCQVQAKQSRQQRANQKYRSSKKGRAVRARLEKQRRLNRKLNSVGDHGSKIADQPSNDVSAGSGAAQRSNSNEEVSGENVLAIDTQSCSAMVQKQFRCEFCNSPFGFYSRRLGESAKVAAHFRRTRRGRPP